MNYSRGDIIEFSFILPANLSKVHPAVIISNEAVHENEDWYICVMMTSTGVDDRFSFPISNEMLLKPNNKNISQARCHLVTYVLKNHIVINSSFNKMKKKFVDRLVERITLAALTDTEEDY